MNQDTPSISVIIPAYNASRVLGACLDALERQTVARERYEIIVVSDGPVETAVETMADRRGVILLAQPRRGAAAARNLGSRQARGDIILFTDADCVPEPNWIEAMVAPFAGSAPSETVEDAPLRQQVVGGCGVVRTHQTSLVPRFIQLEYDYRYRNIARHTQIDFVNTATAAYLRHIFMESGGVREDLLGAEDTELSFRLSSQGYTLAFTPQATVYHSHPESILDYIRRKYHYSYWRVVVYQEYPHKAVADSRTPQIQKIQVGLLILLVATIIGSALWSGLVWLAGALALLFLVVSLPFW